VVSTFRSRTLRIQTGRLAIKLAPRVRIVVAPIETTIRGRR
jgi:hypothetical protein